MALIRSQQIRFEAPLAITGSEGNIVIDSSGSAIIARNLTVSGTLFLANPLSGSVVTSSYSISSSYALTASYALNGGSGGGGGGSFITTGSISASVNLGTASFTITSGSSNFLFVSSSGNIGIGTTTPSRLLHVDEGGTRLYQTFKPGVPTLYVYHGRTENDSTVRFENGSGDNLYFGGNGLFVTGNTNIGSGTTLLGARLGVRGSGTTSSTTALLVQNLDNTFNFNIKDNGDLTSNNNFVTINSYDATINGANKVAINGTNFGTGYIYRGVSTGFLILGNDSTVSTGITLYGSTHATLRDSIRINQSGSTIITVVSGSVGIGTVNPSASLHINGDTILSGSVFSSRQSGSLVVGSTLLYSISTSSYTAGFFDYYVLSGSNGRAGTVMSIWSGSSIQYTDNSTPDMGDTSNFAFSMSLASSNAQLFASASSVGWSVKTSFRTF